MPAQIQPKKPARPMSGPALAKDAKNKIAKPASQTDCFLATRLLPRRHCSVSVEEYPPTTNKQP